MNKNTYESDGTFVNTVIGLTVISLFAYGLIITIGKMIA